MDLIAAELHREALLRLELVAHREADPSEQQAILAADGAAGVEHQLARHARRVSFVATRPDVAEADRTGRKDLDRASSGFFVGTCVVALFANCFQLCDYLEIFRPTCRPFRSDESLKIDEPKCRPEKSNF